MNLSEKSTVFLYQTFFTIFVGVFFVFLVLLTLEQANPLNTKLERDSGIYLYVSSSFEKEELPYIKSWESKPPGIFFIDAVALMIGKGTRWGVWLIEFLFLSASVILGYLLLRKQFGLAPAILGTAIWLLALNRVLAGGNFTEEYALPFGFAALLLWINSEDKKKTIAMDVGIGLCTGLAILLRPNNIGSQAAIVLTMAVLAIRNGEYRKLLLRLISICIAALIPLFAAGSFFANRGAFNEFIQASFFYNLFYTGGHLDIRSSFLGGIENLGFAGGIAILSYFLVVDQLRFQKENSSHQSFLIWMLINGSVEVLLSGLSGKSFEHYFICWMPIVAALSAYLVFHTFPDFCVWAEKNAIRFTILSFLFLLLLYPQLPNQYIETITYLMTQRNRGVQQADLVSEYVNAHTTSGDFVLVWGGQAGINFQSKRDAPTPYIFYPLFEPSPFTDRISAEYLHALEEKSPAMIVDGSIYDPNKIVPLDEKSPLQWSAEHGIYPNPYLFEILNFIRQNYSLVDVISNVSIYEKK